MTLAQVELWKPSGREIVPLSGDRLSIGKAPDNDITLEDPTVSRLHASLERFSSGWCIRDLGSSNGTFVNGERVLADCALRPGDEIRVGETRLSFLSEDPAHAPSVTQTPQAAPQLTPRERDVLLALCRPVLSGSLLTEPAPVKEIASALVVTESAVRKHLNQLYDKFGLDQEATRRRGRLANDAIRRGAVTLADLRAARSDRDQQPPHRDGT